MLIRRPADIPTSEITDESLFWNRREFIEAAGLGVASLTVLPSAVRGRLGPGED